MDSFTYSLYPSNCFIRPGRSEEASVNAAEIWTEFQLSDLPEMMRTIDSFRPSILSLSVPSVIKGNWDKTGI